MSISNKLIVILGPTASGKSKLALRLAKKYNGEIVNADSRQIYKEMHIGTGSPIFKYQIPNTKYQKFIIDKIPHYLFHISAPNKQLNVATYKKLAIKMIKDIQKLGKLPIIVGGTGLYISAIVDNLEIPKAPPNNKIREKLEKHSKKYLFARLSKIDPKSAKVIGPHNKRKLIRSLEVYKITGKPFSCQQMKGKPLFDILQIGIKINREKLYKKIDCRVDEMIKNGLVEETEKLIKKYSSDLPAMTEIGYKEIGLYLAGKTSLKEASQLIKFRTHHYARRQMTWFKRDERIGWVEGYKEVKSIAGRFLK